MSGITYVQSRTLCESCVGDGSNRVAGSVVAELGSSDLAFRVCGIFTDASKSVSAAGLATRHISIEGHLVNV